jgi:uncharacterized protein
MRVWVDFTNTAHVLVLRPLVERLQEAGHEVELTARPLSHTVELLDDWDHPYTVLGEYGGASRMAKAGAAARRAPAMVRFGRGKRFDAALAHGSTDLPIACRVLRIPNTTMFDYEWAVLQHHLNCRLANRVCIPDAIPAERVARYGARGRKLVRYPGLKEEYYMSGFRPDRSLLAELGIGEAADEVLCVVRTAPSYALYLGGSENPLLPRLLKRLGEADGVRTVVLTRNAEQATAVRELGYDRLVVPPRAVDGRSLVALADVLVSAGGTMNREAAFLGTPVWSMFEGRLGAIDEKLAADGKLNLLSQPEDVVLEKKPGPVPDEIPGRDPADLLALALPWVN